MIVDKIALALLIAGGLNWGSIGVFQFDVVAWICGGQSGVVSRIIYTLIGLAAIWCFSLLFRRERRNRDDID
ncbi:MAG: DUF378 domain-containing protein [Oscillospiraceae bacterium]|nr:DUF378 domain-containing protein [Oscillospiraceae bacterium]